MLLKSIDVCSSIGKELSLQSRVDVTGLQRRVHGGLSCCKSDTTTHITKIGLHTCCFTSRKAVAEPQVTAFSLFKLGLGVPLGQSLSTAAES
jgi:hypothetical protein